MGNYERKIIESKTLDVDVKNRQVKVAFAEMQTIDRDREVFDKSSFNKSIRENGPQGTNEIWHLLDHEKNSFHALSKFKEVGIQGDYLYGVSQYKDSFAWREVAWPLYESGDITQHSIGFRTIEKEKSSDGSYTIIKQARIWEGSAVLWGANWNTPTLEIQKGIKSLFDDSEDELENVQNRFDRLIKRIREDKFSEENKSLLLIELMRLQKIKTSTAQESKSTPQEDQGKYIGIIKSFTKQLQNNG